MSKRNKRQGPPKEEFKQADYYKLNTKAVDDLVNANEENSPEVSEAELRKYRSGPKIRIGESLKFALVKWWFAAATCFFIIWGLSGYMDSLDNVLVAGLVLGMVSDILTNNALRFLEKTPGASARWMMFPKKGYATFPQNLVYFLFVMFLVFMTYNVINYTAIELFKLDTIPLPVEPIIFGLFCLGYDSLLISMKRLFKRILSDARKPTP